jgi:hypothetical protein
MVASLITAYAAYYQPGVAQIYVVTTMANYLSPTRAELDAGLDVTRQVRSTEGFAVAAEQIDRPDMSSLFTSKIGGRTGAEDSSLWFYGAQSGTDIRQTLPFGWAGYVVMLDGGDVAGRRMDIYPVLVISKPKQRGDEDPFGIQVQFSITRPPAEDVLIPA